MTTVALDGRGADGGAPVIAAGARAAAADGISVRVFGDPGAFAGLEGSAGIEVLAAPGEITNDEEPVAAVRTREDASIVLAARDVADGRSDALASAGPTGATMTAALFALRRMQGVRRPALALQLLAPGREGAPSILLDVGANTEARAGDLVQFAYLGAAFSRAVLGVDRPRVALLSVGEEAKKGTAQLVEAHAALAGAPGLDFRGNVEGRDLLANRVDVIVTDGFTGNVILKLSEGLQDAVISLIKRELSASVITKTGAVLARPAFQNLKKRLDYAEYGGAPLLGVRRIVVVGHGSSNARAVRNAIRSVKEFSEHGAQERIERGISETYARESVALRASAE